MYGLMISHLHGEPPKTEHAGMRVLANSPAGQHDGLGEALLQATDGLCGELAELRGGQPVRQPQPLQQVDVHEGVHHHPERGLATGGWMMGGGRPVPNLVGNDFLAPCLPPAEGVKMQALRKREFSRDHSTAIPHLGIVSG